MKGDRKGKEHEERSRISVQLGLARDCGKTISCNVK